MAPQAMPKRAESRHIIGAPNPLLFGRRFSLGTFTSVKTNSPVALARKLHWPCVSGVVKPGIPGKPAALLQVDGLVTVDGKPVEAEIELRSMVRDLTMDITVKSNELDGKFLFNLPSRDEYEITVHTNHFPPQVLSLNTNEIDTFVVLNVFAEFHKAEFGEDTRRVQGRRGRGGGAAGEKEED